VRLQERFQEKRERFAILAFHDATVASFAELDAKLAPIVHNTWKDKPLPFPILLDASGETIATWGIRGFPTTVLIDPEGEIVGQVDEERLGQILEEER
jgi:hypothetical protein